jgi:hypothetical protein
VIVEEDYWAPLRYLLQITPDSHQDVLGMASLYHEQSFVEYATPDFYFPRSFEKASPEGRGPKPTGGLPHKRSSNDPGRESVRIPLERFDRPVKVRMSKEYGYVYTRGEIRIGLKREITLEQARPFLQSILDEYQGKLVTSDLYSWGTTVTMAFPDFVDIFILRSILDRLPLFRWAELTTVGRALATYPNDTYFFQNDQWALHNITTGADINAPEAWDIEKSKPNVVIAILDSGIAMGDGVHLSYPNINLQRESIIIQK